MPFCSDAPDFKTISFISFSLFYAFQLYVFFTLWDFNIIYLKASNQPTGFSDSIALLDFYFIYLFFFFFFSFFKLCKTDLK